MTYRVQGRRPGQADTHQTTQMTHQLQLGGAGGINPPSQRTLLGHTEDWDGGGQGHYQAGNMQLSMPAYQPGSPYTPYMGTRNEPHPMVRQPPMKKSSGNPIQRPQF